MTYEQLVLIERDIDKQKKTSDAFAFFNHQKISTFYYTNKEAIELAKKKLKSLREQYIKKDAAGEFMQIKVNGQFQKWVYNSDKDEAQFRAEYDAFMKRRLDVHC